MVYVDSGKSLGWAEGLGDLDGRGLAERLVAIGLQRRALEADAAAVIAEAERREVYAEDGHVSVRGWVKATLRLSNAEVMHRVRTAKLVSALPVCGEELAAGRVGVAQVQELARLHGNPRCGDQLGKVVEDLLEFARTLPYETFNRTTRHWEGLADADGAHRDHDQTHAARRADVNALDDTTYVSARLGAAQGAVVSEVFEAFVRAEFAADWDEVRAGLGDDATPGEMVRSESQRRADALVAIFEAARQGGTASGERVPVVNIVVDQHVFEEQLAAMAEDRAPVFDLDDVVGTRCRSAGGASVDPADAVAAALIGHVRRVVVDADGVIIDLGRKSRLFTGSARTAALLQAALDEAGRCLWPGCIHRRCQVDHCLEWSADHGPTDVTNSGPLCPRHNRWKSRGYRTWRAAAGVWHVQRPDGTEITAA